jgi:hypothetical protein
LRECDGAGLDHDVEPTTQQILHDLGVAPVGNAAQRGAGLHIDQFAGQMVHAAGQVHPIGNVEWGRLGAGDEISKRFDRRIGSGRDHHGVARHQGDEGEILDRIVRQRFGDRSAGGKRSGQHADDITVGRRLGDSVPGGCAGVRRIFDQHGLAEPLAELFGEQPADKIRTAACRRPGYDPDRARWPLLGGGRNSRDYGQRDGEKAREHSHAMDTG